MDIDLMGFETFSMIFLIFCLLYLFLKSEVAQLIPRCRIIFWLLKELNSRKVPIWSDTAVLIQISVFPSKVIQMSRLKKSEKKKWIFFLVQSLLFAGRHNCLQPGPLALSCESKHSSGFNPTPPYNYSLSVV